MIKGSMQEEDITIINIYAHNTGAPQCIRQLLTAMKEEIDSNTIIVGGLHHLTYTNGQKINKETQALYETIDQRDLIDIYRTFHPQTADYTSFSSSHRTFSRIDHIWVTNQASINLRKLKSYQASFLTTTL